jgi:4-hydroxybenzoate polyprenyltransferase
MRLVKTYRIGGWCYYLGFVMLGHVARFGHPSQELIWSLSSASSLLAYAFSLNDYYDGDLERKIFLFPLLCYLAGLPLLNWVQMIISLIFLFIFTAYSHPSTRLKGKPLFSTFANSVSFSLLFLLGSSFANSPFIFLTLVLLNTPAQLLHEMADCEEDRERGDITTTVNYGPEFSKRLSILSLLSAAVLSALTFYFGVVGALFFVSTLAFVIYFCFAINRVDEGFHENLRRRYRNWGVLVGLAYLLSFYLAKS